eukprot:27152-Eustigmatos_ZCMA.PRE.1
MCQQRPSPLKQLGPSSAQVPSNNETIMHHERFSVKAVLALQCAEQPLAVNVAGDMWDEARHLVG